MEVGKRRKRWRVVTAIATLLAIFATAAILSARRPPFDFISELDGRVVASPYRHIEVDSLIFGSEEDAPRLTCFAFQAPKAQVQAAYEKELDAEGWNRVDVSELQQSAYQGTDRTLFSVYLADLMAKDFPAPKGTTCYVIVSRYPTWLEKQWMTIKRWFGK